MSKVLVGMSGGVDSSVAAKVLVDSGYDVTGVTVRMFSPDEVIRKENAASVPSDIEDAKSVAARLGFEHIVFDFSDRFRKYVMNDFIESYISGKTPNPCIECNKHIKFGQMLDRAEELGYDYIATGHYAVKQKDPLTGRYIIKRPADRSKDQTYVLYGLTQKQIEKTLFPLAAYEKSEVRKIAENAGLINSDKPDSQDICFVPDGEYGEFIRSRAADRICEGNFTDTSGNIIGRHKGLIYYTVGQRKGLGIALGKPAFVVSKNCCDNTVVLGTNDDLMSYEVMAEDVNLISIESLDRKMNVTAKIRYNQKDEPAVIYPPENGIMKIVFEKPQRAVTSGQAVVFYDGDVLVGGGRII